MRGRRVIGVVLSCAALWILVAALGTRAAEAGWVGRGGGLQHGGSGAPAATTPPAQGKAAQTKQEADAQARKVLEEMGAGKFGQVVGQMNGRMASLINAGKLSQVWEQIQGMAGGKYAGVVSSQVSESQGHQVVKLSCDFGQSLVPATVALDGEGRIAGLFFGQPKSKVAWAPAEYVHREKFEEQAVKVGKAPYELAGTLTLPKEKSPVEAVVLVKC